MKQLAHVLVLVLAMISLHSAILADGPMKWQPISPSSPISSSNILKTVSNPYQLGHMVALGSGHGQVWHSYDNGSTWKRVGASFPTSVGVSDVTFRDEKTILITLVKGDSFQGIVRSKDGGVTWLIQSGPEQGLPILNLPGRAQSILAVADKSSTIYLAAGGKVYTSTDSGSNWGKISHDSGDGGDAGGLPKTATVSLAGRFGWGGVVFGGDAGVWYVHPEGFLRDLKSSFSNITKVSVDQNDVVYAICSGQTDHGLYQFDPSKDRWTHLKDENGLSDIAIDPHDPNKMVLISHEVPSTHTSPALWISVDAGKSWTRSMSGLPSTGFNHVAYDSSHRGRMILSTNRGIWIANN